MPPGLPKLLADLRARQRLKGRLHELRRLALLAGDGYETQSVAGLIRVAEIELVLWQERIDALTENLFSRD